MITHDSGVYMYLHWFWSAFFVLFGIFLAFRSPWYSTVSCNSVRVRPGDRERMEAAVARRRSAEQLSKTPGYIASGAAVAMGIVCWFTALPPALLYGIFCLLLALSSGIAYLQVRNSQTTRVAVLSARTNYSVIPAWAFALATASALSLLTYTSRQDLKISASIVCCSALATLFVAWRLTQLPALLQGVDLQSETALDERLRFMRSAAPLIFASVQPFVYASQVIAGNTQVQTAAYVLSIVAWIGISLWVMRVQFRAISLGPDMKAAAG